MMAADVATTTVPASPPFAPGVFMWRKYGPLQVWGYAAVVLGLLLVWVWLRRGKAADQTAAATAGTDFANLPANQKSQPVFIVPQATPPAVNVSSPITVTVPNQPAGSGRDHPPGNTGSQFYDATPADNVYAIWWNQAKGSTGVPWTTFESLNGGHDAFYKTFHFGPDKDALGSAIPHPNTNVRYRVT